MDLKIVKTFRTKLNIPDVNWGDESRELNDTEIYEIRANINAKITSLLQDLFSDGLSTVPTFDPDVVVRMVKDSAERLLLCNPKDLSARSTVVKIQERLKSCLHTMTAPKNKSLKPTQSGASSKYEERLNAAVRYPEHRHQQASQEHVKRLDQLQTSFMDLHSKDPLFVKLVTGSLSAQTLWHSFEDAHLFLEHNKAQMFPNLSEGS
jgi:hypothetical protein